MELIQKNCAGLPDEAVVDCSRGMAAGLTPKPNDELQMRIFWRQWRDLVGQGAM
jgi:hypothetical protein